MDAAVLKALDARLEQAGTQRRLAEELGVSESTLSRVMAGKQEASLKLLEALGLRVVYVKV